MTQAIAASVATENISRSLLSSSIISSNDYMLKEPFTTIETIKISNSGNNALQSMFLKLDIQLDHIVDLILDEIGKDDIGLVAWR